MKRDCRVHPLALRAALTAALLVGPTTSGEAATAVTVRKAPDGIQPQAVVDARGTLHLLTFQGKPGEGDLFYVRREAGRKDFTEPLRVNSQPGSAIAVGTIRGGQLAVGKGGRVHVAWNGSGAARPKGADGDTPMLYARLNDARTAFEPQRNLMRLTGVLDGGGTVAADATGNVYVAWHARGPRRKEGEGGRAVWLAVSTDEGKTFAREKEAWARPTGACGCCGMKAHADRKGNLYLLYRSATDTVHRDVYLLTSKDRGKSFSGTLLEKWKTGICPMSSEAFAEGDGGVFAAWETAGAVSFVRIDPATLEVGKPHAPAGGKNRKHPALAVNARGEVLLAWAEGTGWQQGGGLAWQVFDRAGRPTPEKGRMEKGVPVWGLPAAVATGDGFLVFH